MNIILCGLPRCGKTTQGKLLAEELGLNFLDTDHEIEKAHKKSCAELYKEGTFRPAEKKQIASLMGLKRHVIATGGGTFCDPENAKILQSLGCIVYLKVNPDTVWERMCRDGFPIFLQTRRDFDHMVKERLPIFESVASHTVSD